MARFPHAPDLVPVPGVSSTPASALRALDRGVATVLGVAAPCIQHRVVHSPQLLALSPEVICGFSSGGANNWDVDQAARMSSALLQNAGSDDAPPKHTCAVPAGVALLPDVNAKRPAVVLAVPGAVRAAAHRQEGTR